MEICFNNFKHNAESNETKDLPQVLHKIPFSTLNYLKGIRKNTMKEKSHVLLALLSKQYVYIYHFCPLKTVE